jgi:hypothetical protein
MSCSKCESRCNIDTPRLELVPHVQWPYRGKEWHIRADGLHLVAADRPAIKILQYLQYGVNAQVHRNLPPYQKSCANCKSNRR